MKTVNSEPEEKQAPLEGGKFETPFIDAPPEATPTAFSSKSGKADRRGSVSVKYGDDGIPDFDSLKGKQLEKWEELCNSPEFQQRFGLQPKTFEVDPKMVEGLLDVLGRVQATAFSLKFKIPYDLSLKVSQFSEDEKEALIPPSKRVIEKHAPALAAKYGDEIVLAGLMTNITLAKMGMCKQIAAEFAEREKARSKANGAAVPQEQPQAGVTV